MARRQGRPTACTPLMIQTLAQCVEDGLSIEKACDLNEISTTSFNEWRNRGETGEQPFTDFLVAIKKALAVRTNRRIKRIQECAEDRKTIGAQGQEIIVKGDWQANAWLQERQDRQEFGRYVTKLNILPAPENSSEIDQILFMSKQIVDKLSTGEISAEAAKMAMEIVEIRRKTIETSELAKQIAELSAKLK